VGINTQTIPSTRTLPLPLNANGAQTATDLNDLQSQINTINSSISTLQGQVSTLQSQMTTANSNISTLQGQMTTANNNISTLQSQMTTVQNNITTLQNQMAQAQSDITSLENWQTTTNGRLNTIESEQTTQTQSIQDLDNRVTALESGTVHEGPYIGTMVHLRDQFKHCQPAICYEDYAGRNGPGTISVVVIQPMREMISPWDSCIEVIAEDGQVNPAPFTTWHWPENAYPARFARMKLLAGYR